VTLRDTGGQERYRTLTALHFRKAQGIILVYDITNEKSFHSLGKRITDIEQYQSPDAVKIVIGNKTDLKSSRAVHLDDLKKFAIDSGVLFYETSAKDGHGVDAAITELLQEIIKKHEIL